MSFTIFILAWLISVVWMTLFSALWSALSGNQFMESALISRLLNANLDKTTSQKQTYVLGWVIHFALGIVFLGIYEVLWEITNLERSLIWGLVFGGILGVLGVLGWKFLFKTLNFPSDFNYTQYYIHIFFAHLVFSFTALFVYHWFY
ncbi:hypothetical protein LX77_01728 [Gelidibacter algens]|uniref:DUF2938 domain-containing protein n=1 Tax=Gelidibacter algens TaxID=49280 RepID=A0A327S8R1_9FLAO|nr:hypothetical protein [Gelidibacter algens]RAJ24732.1 hypothetical protein LX77_01728 [Gelidibacter algens]